jgi:integrase
MAVCAMRLVKWSAPFVQPFRRPVSERRSAGVTPHTLRRLVMSGVDLRAVQVLGGWQTIGMVERYSHLSPAHLAQVVEKSAEFPYSVPYTDSGTLSVAR